MGYDDVRGRAGLNGGEVAGAAPPVRGEVAAFVDFENIRYSTINSFGQEPNPISWRDKALSYGLMAVARAYADFDQHPPNMRMKLDVAGFEAQHYPAKRTSDAQGREKIQSRADLNFVVDVINTALTRPDIETFLLFTGDKDFIRLVTTLRNRLGKKVIISGVPGSVSPDLVAAAGAEDPLQIAQSVDVDKQVVRAIFAYVEQLHSGFVPTQSHMSRTLWRFLDRTILPSEHIEAKVMEFLRKGILTKRQTVNGQGQELVTTELNPSHPLVQEALPGYQGQAVAGLPPIAGSAEPYDEDDEYEDEYEGEDDEEDETLDVAGAAPDTGYAYAVEDEEIDPEDNRGNLITSSEARTIRTR
ncbi:MAG TPA: NYN domain-containing protein [Thermomicrobiales bacterium]|nr:NYN domain-containing protein [Thermomicrobiales bacterium]